MKPQINLLVIRTTTPATLAEFYTILGMEFSYHQHGSGPFHYSAEIEDFVFEIYPLLKSQSVADKSVRLGFTVEGLKFVIESLESKGHTIIKQPFHSEWGYMAIIADLDGRKIELKEGLLSNYCCIP